MSVGSKPYAARTVVSLIYFHEIIKTALSGRPFIMTATFPDSPKFLKSLMQLSFL